MASPLWHALYYSLLSRDIFRYICCGISSEKHKRLHPSEIYPKRQKNISLTIAELNLEKNVISLEPMKFQEQALFNFLTKLPH